MIALYLVFVTFLSTVVRLTNAHCHQCWGKQVLTFTSDVSHQQVLDFFGATIKACATGLDIHVNHVTQNDKTYTIDLMIWRYCATGKSNYVNKGPHCIGGVCVSQDYRMLTCGIAVKCAERCYGPACGD